MNEKEQSIISKLFFISTYVLAIFLCFPYFQDLLLSIGSNYILHREVNHPEIWTYRLILLAFDVFIFSLFLALRIQKTYILFLCFIAFVASSFFNSFPFITHSHGTDSSVFIYIGQMMHKGFVPYRDMFDHKGLYLYFFEFLGTSKAGYTAIYLLDFISLFISALFIYKICFLQINVVKSSLACTFFILCIGGFLVYEGGNLTESYALPCISYSLYTFLKYLKTQKCSYSEIVFVGITFTVVLFLRANMVAMWVFFVLAITIQLLMKKQFAYFGKIVFFFTAGVFIASLPIVIYLFATNSAKDLWESYILFNLKYINASSYSNKFAAMRYFVKLLILPIILLVISLVKNHKNKMILIDIAAFLFAFYFVIISGRSFGHYGMVLLPYFALPIANLFRKDSSFYFPKIPKHLFCALIACFLVLFVFSITQTKRFSSSKSNDIVSYLKKNTEAADDVLVLGNDVHYNIDANRFTAQRFFYQSPICLINHAFFEEFESGILSKVPDYIVCPEVRKDFLEKEPFSSLLENISTQYEKLSFTDGYVLKRLNTP